MMLVADGQLLAAFGAAAGQHAAAVLRGHALAEAMLVHAAAVVGLKCSFHRFFILCLSPLSQGVGRPGNPPVNIIVNCCFYHPNVPNEG